MARLRFPKGKQREFLIKNRMKLSETDDDMAAVCNVNRRTLFDWEREKYNMNHGAALELVKVTGISIPKTARILSDSWNCSKAASLGAFARMSRYGNPGTSEGRAKGGRNACEFFRLNPEKARERRFSTLKETNIPARCADLAEFIGIMLGDGGIHTKYQCIVSLNYETERAYVEYVCGLIKRLFSVDPIIFRKKGTKGCDIIVSSVSVVVFLLGQGLTTGNKIKHQVDIPAWIKENLEFQKLCVRGLFDTDGSLYRHKYKVNNKIYEYLKLDFTSCSKPLLNSAHEILTNLGIRSFVNGVHISIPAKAEVEKYRRIVSSSSDKFITIWNALA